MFSDRDRLFNCNTVTMSDKQGTFYHYHLIKYLLRDSEIALYYFQELHPNWSVYAIHDYIRKKFPDRYLEAIDEYSFNLRLQGEIKTLRQKCRLIQAKEKLAQIKDNS